MVRIKPRDIQLVQTLARFNKPYWSVTDLQKILGYGSRQTLLVVLHRLVGQGILTRMRPSRRTFSIRPPIFPSSRPFRATES
jgi:hypothetical protein